MQGDGNRDASSPEDNRLASELRTSWLGGPRPGHFLTRFVLLRGLGLIYTVAFAVLLFQWRGLIGSHGLLPAERYMARIREHVGFWERPGIFYADSSDAMLGFFGGLGLVLSLCVLFGVDSALLMLALWAIYLSFCHAGQLFWGYGWEILLLEAGFLSVFLCPLVGGLSLRNRLPPPGVVIVLLRWLLVRLMLGAGLIKLRGDPCWRDLTCLAFHYETQPVPSPLSYFIHRAPMLVHQLGVLFNHGVELVVPFGLFGPRRVRHIAALLTIAFQVSLILSGNLSFLNWLTLAVTLACFDDAAWSRVLPLRLSRASAQLEREKTSSRAQLAASVLLTVMVFLLSAGPVTNMLSRRQAMNTSFDPLHLVNTYGAFGSIGRTRDEVVIEGTLDEHLTASTQFFEYELPCKPGDVERRPCLITPYHYRLDWQLWFAAMSNAGDEPWLVHLAYKLLVAEPEVLALFAHDPFDGKPPRYVRMLHYEYRFTEAFSSERSWWKRTRKGTYLPPVSRDHPELLEYLRAHDLID